jgi:hypothetical protein
LQETHLTEEKETKCWLEVKVWKKVFHANGPHKQAGITIPISDKEDLNKTSHKRQ